MLVTNNKHLRRDTAILSRRSHAGTPLAGRRQDAAVQEQPNGAGPQAQRAEVAVSAVAPAGSFAAAFPDAWLLREARTP